jgi:hypothetical protein
MQTTDTVFLVRPASFSYNKETAVSNTFQNEINTVAEGLQAKALEEFNIFVSKLERKGISVQVFDDTPLPIKPDAIFPNNWISIHADGRLVLYPMCTPNRQAERRLDIVEQLKEQYLISEVIDLSRYEQEERYLEGTGSIIFDHKNKIAYACLSKRTDKLLFEEVVTSLGYEALSFYAFDKNGTAIYHTNVMMSVGDGFCVICLESITDELEQDTIRNSLLNSGLEIVEISLGQVNNFAGNMLALYARKQQFLVLSQSAYNCLKKEQKKQLEIYCELLPLAISTIETVGGGSARCMICEIFY